MRDVKHNKMIMLFLSFLFEIYLRIAVHVLLLLPLLQRQRYCSQGKSISGPWDVAWCRCLMPPLHTDCLYAGHILVCDPCCVLILNPPPQLLRPNRFLSSRFTHRQIVPISFSLSDLNYLCIGYCCLWSLSACPHTVSHKCLRLRNNTCI